VCGNSPLSDEQYLNVDGGAAEGSIGFCLYPDPNQDQSAGVREYRRLAGFVCELKNGRFDPISGWLVP